jgi:GGDEF domain-containing protein
VDRFTLIESRFGKGAIDQVIVFFAQYFEERLTRVDRLFRWSDNALIAVIIRDSPSDSVRAEITRYASAKLEMMLKHHGRQILLPMSSSWTMFRSSEGGSVSALVRKIDGFLRNEMHLKESF